MSCFPSFRHFRHRHRGKKVEPLLRVCRIAHCTLLSFETKHEGNFIVGRPNNYSIIVGYEMVIANSALRASLAIYHVISNARSWNNCEIVFEVNFHLCSPSLRRIIVLVQISYLNIEDYKITD